MFAIEQEETAGVIVDVIVAVAEMYEEYKMVELDVLETVMIGRACILRTEREEKYSGKSIEEAGIYLAAAVIMYVWKAREERMEETIKALEERMVEDVC